MTSFSLTRCRLIYRGSLSLWLRLATSSSGRFEAASSYLFVRKILYAIHPGLRSASEGLQHRSNLAHVGCWSPGKARRARSESGLRYPRLGGLENTR
jgi:hypothetical protein